MSLAIRNQDGGLPAQRQMPASVMTFQETWELACYAAKSNLFGTTTPEQAICLMMLSQAEGLHPILAMRRYHVIKGKPSMRADAMQAEFQAKGGTIRIIERSEKRACAAFAHPVHAPEPVEFSFSMEDARTAGLLASDMYKKYPAVMLWARLVTMAIRTIFPGIIAGIYSTEEIEDMHESATPASVHASVQRSADLTIAQADAPVPGWNPAEPDTRPYHQLVADAVNATNAECGDAATPLDARKVHGILALKAVNTDHADGPAPTKVAAAVAFMTKVYAAHRQWVRSELALICGEYARDAAEALMARREAEAQDAAEQPAPADLGWVHQAGGGNDPQDGDDPDGIPEPGANG